MIIPASRCLALFGVSDRERVMRGTSRCECLRLTTRAIADAPGRDHAHGTLSILAPYRCWFSDSIVPSEGPSTAMRSMSLRR